MSITFKNNRVDQIVSTPLSLNNLSGRAQDLQLHLVVYTHTHTLTGGLQSLTKQKTS